MLGSRASDCGKNDTDSFFHRQMAYEHWGNCMSRRNKLAGASTLAITVALSLGGGSAPVAAQSAYTWNSGDYTNPAGTTLSNTVGVTVGGTTGTLTNQGAITGSQNGISDTGNAVGAVINSGTITGTANAGINMGTGAGITSLSNQAGGTITGTNYGIDNAAGTIGTLTNSGTISNTSSSSGAALRNTSSTSTIGTLTNTAAIISNRTGIVNYGGIGTVTNSGTISGSSTGIYNNGRIGTITNSGLIRGTTSGGGVTNVSSTLGTLTNSGTITGATSGIRNQNSTITTLNNLAGATISGSQRGIYNETTGTLTTTITSINNAGTITGTQYAVHNAGTMGTLTNSGAIIGNILNSSATGLTIAGGSGDTFGTLTGLSGSIGTITHTASNLLFSSGNLLLNDHITATGRTVSNTGATLRLDNTVTITGTYNQTGGGLTSTGSGGTNAKLVVDGDATVSNSTIILSTTGLAAGQTITIVDATNGHTGTYTGNTARMGVTNGLAATASTSGNDLVLVLATDSANTYTQKGITTGGAAAPVGRVLDSIRADTSSTAVAFQNQVLTPLDALPTSSQGQAIKQLAPQTTPSAQMTSAAATAVLGAVEQHQQTAMAYDPATGVAAGSEAKDTAAWGQVLGGSARRGSNAEADGYRLTDFGLAVGIDHRFTPDAMGGVALSWVRAWSQGSGNSSGSSSTMDSYQLTFYGTYRLDRAFVDGQLGVGWNEFDQSRGIAFLGRTAAATYSGQQYLAKASVGYDVPVTDSVTVTPLAGLRWLRSETDSYDESGAGAANLSVSSHAVNSMTHDLGAKVIWNLPTAQGVLRPEARLAWVHDYTSGPIATSGIMGGQAFSVSTPRTEPNGVRVGLAATLGTDGDLSFRAEYESELRPQYQSHTALLKTLWGF